LATLNCGLTFDKSHQIPVLSRVASLGVSCRRNLARSRS